jgi:hypothetical protein
MLFGGTALAFVVLPLTLSDAAAQTNCLEGTAAYAPCLAQQQQILSSFATLPNSSAGLNLLQQNLTAVENIYLNATVGQRNQAADNYDLSTYHPQYNVEAQIGPNRSMDLGWREKLFAQLRLGWSHEYANVGRPVTATLAGAPGFPSPAAGASPRRPTAPSSASAPTLPSPRPPRSTSDTRASSPNRTMPTPSPPDCA